jgi:hypothetical protein
MLIETILVLISTASGIIGTLLKDPPAKVKALLVALVVLGGLPPRRKTTLTNKI